MNIELLPEHIIDQIKAGEVLERPAALLKELIENSIDAKSTEIHIHLVDNGLTLLSIEDNGVGMDFTNLPMAFLRHATSKLKNFEDIYNLHSYGFRGEALASLSASARLTCTSQPANLQLQGGKVIIHGGKLELHTPQTSSSQGTALFIKDLFYNTPARLKFIKSQTSEKIQLKKIITSFVISHPEIQFTIKWDDKEKEFFKKLPSNQYKNRIENIFPNQSTIFSAEETYLNYRVRLFFTKEASRNNNHKHQYLFVNSRYFQDKSIHQSLIRNLESLWHFGESGHYLIMIDTPPDAIDVKVPPNKTKIKFLDSDVVYSLLVTAIKSAIKVVSHAPLILPVQSISAQSYDPSHFSAINLAQSSPPKESSLENEFILINNAFVLHQKESHYFLIYLKKLTEEVIINNINKCLKNDENISPLLVSEPFTVKNITIDKSFDQLKKMGFEFDRLSSDVIILRTIPKDLPRALLQYTVDTLIEFFSQLSPLYNQEKFETYFSRVTDCKITFNSMLVQVLIKQSNLENNNIMIQLTDEKLWHLFK